VESVLAAPPGPLLERVDRAGWTAHRWPSRGDGDVIAAWHAGALVRRERPDVVHLHSARAHALAALPAHHGGARVIVSRRVAVTPGRDLWSRWKYSWPVDRYLCVSEAARQSLIAGGVDRSRTTVVPSGIPLADWRRRAASPRTDLRLSLGLGPGVPLLGTVAALTTEKNHPMLLRVALRLSALEPRPHWVWIGEGPERARLEWERDRLGLHEQVHFLGRRDDVPAMTAQFTLAVIASRHEGFCGVAVEAMALGVPVVATAVGGIPEVVPQEAGVLTPDDDAEAMAAAVRHLLESPAERDRRRAAARVAAERFDTAETARATLASYREVLAQGNVPRGPA
jgi:glycosyltransferase involved in cell wall biosynthesis